MAGKLNSDEVLGCENLVNSAKVPEKPSCLTFIAVFHTLKLFQNFVQL